MNLTKSAILGANAPSVAQAVRPDTDLEHVARRLSTLIDGINSLRRGISDTADKLYGSDLGKDEASELPPPPSGAIENIRNLLDDADAAVSRAFDQVGRLNRL